ncbi:hypothetical protein [Glutamicibacter sp.]|uniref:hypothetical protein n=1 Tax=Glutamicibacter sp. TaxID=1931995 RepID=UPI0028BD624F|nr:hypothetical protein [Glutamicibacter sp.]
MNELHPLGELIQAAQDRYGWSTRDMEREADKHGLRMAHSNFSRLKLEPVVAIKATQIQALAKVLRISEQTVARAAISSMGVDLDEKLADPGDALRSAADLSERDKRILLSALTAMRQEESSDDAKSNTPKQAHIAPRLRAVEPDSDHPGKEQKTEPEGFSITEIHGAETAKYPVPPIEQLAAHPKVKTTREWLDETTGERQSDKDQ